MIFVEVWHHSQLLATLCRKALPGRPQRVGKWAFVYAEIRLGRLTFLFSLLYYQSVAIQSGQCRMELCPYQGLAPHFFAQALRRGDCVKEAIYRGPHRISKKLLSGRLLKSVLGPPNSYSRYISMYHWSFSRRPLLLPGQCKRFTTGP